MIKPAVSNLRGCIIGLSCILLLWLLSLSSSGSNFDRPLGAHHEWLTAHTLLSLRGFEQWGFIKTVGMSVVLPYTPESREIDLRQAAGQGVYVSYPTAFLWAPYLLWKAAGLVGLWSADLAKLPTFIESFNLLYCRLLQAFFIFLICFEILPLLVPAKPNITALLLSSLLVTALWLLNAPNMYWTQNVYFADQAVLTPIFALIFVILVGLRREAIYSRRFRLIIFSLAFLACSSEWFGFLSCALLGATLFCCELFGVYLQSRKWSTSLLRALVASLPIVCAAALSLLIYIGQLLYFKGAFAVLWERAATRAITNKIDQNNSLDLNALVHVASVRLEPYLPHLFQDPLNWSLILPLLYFSILVFCLAFFWCKRAQERKMLLIGLVSIFLAPCLSVLLLAQHFDVHDFATFKLSFPLLLALSGLPALFICWFFKVTLRSGQVANLLLSVIAWLLISAQWSKLKDKFEEFALPDALGPKQYGEFVAKNFREKTVLFSDNPINLFPPEVQWYAGRLVHSPFQAPNYPIKLDCEKIKTFRQFYLSSSVQSFERLQLPCHNQVRSMPISSDQTIFYCQLKKGTLSPALCKQGS